VRRRLTFAIVGVTVGALVVAGLGTLLLVRRSDRQAARQDLLRQATAVAQAADQGNALAILRQAQRLEDGSMVQIGPLGGLRTRPPSGLTARDLHPFTLLSGQPVSGFRGSLAFAAVPVHLPTGTVTVAVVLTRPVQGAQRATGYFLLSAAAALVIAAAVAATVGRRITRPLRAAQDATRQIAGGDLDVRVPVAPDDYPELASLTTSINAMAASLARSRGLERQFLMSVSHDLRTPLTSIRGFAEAIADGATTDVTRAAEVIAGESRRLERLVRDLLDLAKLDARQFSLDVRRVDLAEVVADTAEGFRPAADDAGLELVVDDPGSAVGGGLWVAADPDRLAQVVANLVENAFKFAAGRITVTVGPGTGTGPAFGPGTGTGGGPSPDDGWSVLTVTDDGPGIAAADLTHVFERQYQSLRASARQAGSGLGLAIVAELIHAMGGTARAESPVTGTGGTRMVVSLRRWSSSWTAAGSSSTPVA